VKSTRPSVVGKTREFCKSIWKNWLGIWEWFSVTRILELLRCAKKMSQLTCEQDYLVDFWLQARLQKLSDDLQACNQSLLHSLAAKRTVFLGGKTFLSILESTHSRSLLQQSSQLWGMKAKWNTHSWISTQHRERNYSFWFWRVRSGRTKNDTAGWMRLRWLQWRGWRGNDAIVINTSSYSGWG